MAPKRKAATLLLDESPTRRTKAHLTHEDLPEIPTRTLRSRPKPNNLAISSPTTPRRNLRTYGKHGSPRKPSQSDRHTGLDLKDTQIEPGEVNSSRDELDLLSPSDTNRPPPAKKKAGILLHSSRLSFRLPQHLSYCLNAQKRAIIHALNNISEASNDDDQEPSTNSAALEQLTNLLDGTITRGEGNSCLILGPKGSGKSRLVEQCLSRISGEPPFVIRLSGWTQYNDRLAMREIAYQLGRLTGASFPIDEALKNSDENEDNPFLDTSAASKITLPPASHLPALISILPTLQQPTIVILDGFDLFALHPRQFLLYCLLDTVQNCSRSSGARGFALIGLSTRFDTISMLEKRVKSRFSGRMIRTASPRTSHTWKEIIRSVMSTDIDDFVTSQPNQLIVEWKALWTEIVKSFIDDELVQKIWNETFDVTRDIRMLNRMLLSVVLRLSPSSPNLSSAHLKSAFIAQQARPRLPLLHVLPYPSICLLIASVHADAAGHPTFTFEMLDKYFRDQVRSSSSAPVQVNGGSIGMVRCGRQVLLTAFENLISVKAFVPATVHIPSVAKVFAKYRSSISKSEVRNMVDRTSQVNLKKWFAKSTSVI